MADELEVIPSVQSPKGIEPAKTVQHTGEKNTYINQADQVNIVLQPASAPKILQQIKQPSQMAFNRTYYNIIVSYRLDFSQDTPFVFDPKRALTEGMDDNLKEEYSTLSDEAVEKIKTFPTLFANENTAYGHTDEDQTLAFGYIRHIKVRKAGIKIYPHFLYPIPQQRLNEALMDLDLWGENAFNEFNRTHWSIKKVDLISELQELGFQI